MLAVYYLCPKSLRNLILVCFSLFFYWWGEHRFVWVMIGSIAVNYLFALAVDCHRGQNAAKWIVAAAVAVNLSALVFFKYTDFIILNVSHVWQAWGGNPLLAPGIHLPIGISFFTFHSLSYVIDVYRKHQDPIYRLDATALYISLFPQLIAGPILRYGYIQGQLIERPHTIDKMSHGIQRFTIGLGKKMLIANTLAIPVDQIFNLHESALNPALAWVGILCYTLQIYYDFSGYSDMAIGLGHMFGFTFMENFTYPYASASIQEFWRRWHISLSSWFRDYLYIPLGGNQKGTLRTGINLMTVFFLCGLWHGASWNFIIWGLFHGAFLVMERGVRWGGGGEVKVFRHIYVWSIVMVAWVFFRAETLPQAISYLSVMSGQANAQGPFQPVQFFVGNETIAALLAGLLGAFPIVPWMKERIKSQRVLTPDGKNLWKAGMFHATETLVIAFILFGCVVKLSAGTYNPFIYFRF